jgi:predicted phosphodiesterase
MTLSEDLSKLASAGQSGSDTRTTNPPEAWRPRLEVDSASGGFFVSTPRTAGDLPDAVDLLSDFDLDPNVWRVTGVRRSMWQKYDGEWLESAKVSIVPADQVHSSADDTDLQALIDHVERWRPHARIKAHTGELSAVYAIGDTQWGKDAGDGTEGTVRRVLTGIEESVQRHKDLIRIGRPVGTVILPQMGDCIEGSVSQNGKVLGRSDLSVTQQVRVGRRMLLAWIKAFAPLTEELIVPVVPGNHDESQRYVIGEATDSWQVEVASAVQDACAENPALAHVQFRYPESDHQTLAINVSESILGLAHGHQSRDAVKWWQGQATGRTPVGDADVLLTAHYHHYKVSQVGPRLWVQIPAMDGGSPWWRDRAGLESPTGIVSFVMGEGYDPRRDLSVLAGEQR